MSIVEKAVELARSSDRRRVDSVPAGSVSGDDGTPPAIASQAPSNIVDTRGVADHGLLSIADDPILAQGFRFLKRPLLARVFGVARNETAAGHIVLVTSDLPGAGKSFVSYNLAASIAQEQMINVILVDADPLRRNLTTALCQKHAPGLLELLLDDSTTPDSVLLDTDMPNLQFIPSGQPRSNSTELLASKRLINALESMDDPDTIILLDSPPMLLTPEARVLAEKVDHTLVVVEAGRTSAADATAVLKMLSEAESSVSFILNKAPEFGGGPEVGYYGYGYGYGYGEESESRD